MHRVHHYTLTTILHCMQSCIAFSKNGSCQGKQCNKKEKNCCISKMKEAELRISKTITFNFQYMNAGVVAFPVVAKGSYILRLDDSAKCRNTSTPFTVLEHICLGLSVETDHLRLTTRVACTHLLKTKAVAVAQPYQSTRGTRRPLKGLQ